MENKPLEKNILDSSSQFYLKNEHRQRSALKDLVVAVVFLLISFSSLYIPFKKNEIKNQNILLIGNLQEQVTQANLQALLINFSDNRDLGKLSLIIENINRNIEEAKLKNTNVKFSSIFEAIDSSWHKNVQIINHLINDGSKTTRDELKSQRLSLSAAQENMEKSIIELQELIIVRAQYNVLFFILSLILLCLGVAAVLLSVRTIKGNSREMLVTLTVLEKNIIDKNKTIELIRQTEGMLNNGFSSRVNSTDKLLLPIASAIEKVRLRVAKIVKSATENAHLFNKTIAKVNECAKTAEDSQTEQIKTFRRVAEKIEQITNEVGGIAQAIWTSKEEFNKSKQISSESKNAIIESIHKMDEIRNTIQDSSKKIKKLGESAQAINEAIELIKNITKQINILALNSAIQAASSSEGGKEFSIVAQEVQRLAFESQSATRKIETLIEEIQTDTASAIASMEKTTQEVVIGSRLTDTLGYSLKQIETHASFLALQTSESSNSIENKSEEMVAIALEFKRIGAVSDKILEDICLIHEQGVKLNAIAGNMLNDIK